jgi:hypothetical protein
MGEKPRQSGVMRYYNRENRKGSSTKDAKAVKDAKDAKETKDAKE